MCSHLPVYYIPGKFLYNQLEALSGCSISEVFAFNMKILIAIFVVYERYILKTNISKEFFLLVYFDMSGRILSSLKKYLYKLQWPNRSRTRRHSGCGYLKAWSRKRDIKNMNRTDSYGYSNKISKIVTYNTYFLSSQVNFHL